MALNFLYFVNSLEISFSEEAHKNANDPDEQAKIGNWNNNLEKRNSYKKK